MARPVLLGIVGDSGSGKTTLARGLVRILGEDQVTHLSADGYHRYDRHQRSERGITPLHPDSNYVDVLAQHLQHLRSRQAVLAPTYNHRDGTFGAATYLRPTQFTVVEGMLAFHSRPMRDVYDVRVFLDPPEDLRRMWKVQRDCSRRGYTTDQALEEIDRREGDAEAYIRPQRRYADLVVSFMPGDRGDQGHLDAKITMGPGLVHPDLSPLVDNAHGIRLVERGSEHYLWIPGTIDEDRSAAIQAAVWARMPFASHLRSERLGEFTVGTQLHRSQSLAITQLLVLYQLVTARAAISVGGMGTRADRGPTATVTTPR